MVRFEVGPLKHLYQVHLGLLVKASKFFDAAFRVDNSGTGFKEAIEKAMQFPEDSSETFRYFTHWLYTGRYPSLSTASPEDQDRTFKRLVRLHVFSDKYGIEKLGLDICGAIIATLLVPDPDGRYENTKGIPRIRTAVWAWNKTNEGSPVRGLIVKCYGVSFEPGWLSNSEGKDALLNCPSLMMELLITSSARQIPRSYYDWQTMLKKCIKEPT